jgi:co-chaperonin GroES (HSP10)
MINESGIRPKGPRILILPEQVEEVSTGGIIMHTATQGDREALAQMYGTVVAMGDDCYSDTNSVWCKIGDRVSFAKYSGLLYEGIDKKKYRCINDLDVVSEVDEGVK